MLKTTFWDIVMLIIFLSVILLSGDIIGKSLPREMPQIKSSIFERILPTDAKKFDIETIKNKKGIAQMFVTYNLSALESSQSRNLDFKSDLWLFFDIMQIIPQEIIIDMFYFNSNEVQMEFTSSFEDMENFCIGLASTAKFTTINYADLGDKYRITVTRKK